ncbi:MAG TPA: FHA domain-containing protein [bacterium]
MQAKLICKSDKGTQELRIDNEATIGKDSGNSIVLAENNISRRHARIFFDAGENSFILEDLKSRNGTRLDGERVYGKERLDNLHVITFGNQFDLFFQVVRNEEESVDSEVIETSPVRQTDVTVVEHDFNGAQNSKTVFDDGFIEMPEILTGTRKRPSVDSKLVAIQADSILSDDEGTIATPEPDLPFEEADLASSFTLVIAGLNQKYRLKQGKNVIGRTSRCDIAIRHETVSRQHACISVKNDKVRIHDLNSKNHTFVGRRRVLQVTEITPFASLRFGEVDAELKHEK